MSFERPSDTDCEDGRSGQRHNTRCSSASRADRGQLGSSVTTGDIGSTGTIDSSDQSQVTHVEHLQRVPPMSAPLSTPMSTPSVEVVHNVVDVDKSVCIPGLQRSGRAIKEPIKVTSWGSQGLPKEIQEIAWIL